MNSIQPLLEVSGVVKSFTRNRLWGKSARLTAVDNVSFQVEQGTAIGLVGESGSGKSTLGELILGLQRPDEGHIYFQGIDPASTNPQQRRIVTREMQVIFQNSLESLNPRMTVEELIAEPMKLHGLFSSRKALLEETYRLMQEVGLPEEFGRRRPAEMSGGQCQRIAIARSLGLKPSFIVCDEIVSALDVSLQTQVLLLLKDLQHQYGITYLFISHDLHVVRLFCDSIFVMQQGQIIDRGTPHYIFEESVVPYTKQLIQSIPSRRRE
jgi:peptide/nickel transport system ATP-binding protein